jgi:hypothetical protein
MRREAQEVEASRTPRHLPVVFETGVAIPVGPDW